MENIFVEFLPPWVETGLQPAFYDKESGSVLQQTARMYARVNMLIRMFNKLSKQTKETVDHYIAEFTTLYNYVHDYFDNLDVQEEINNKIDAMYDDGTLAELLRNVIDHIYFDTTADMLQFENFVVGDIVKTLGYASINDGGASTFIISDDSLTADDKAIYEVNDGLFAVLVPEGKKINVKQFGITGKSNYDTDFAWLASYINTNAIEEVDFNDETYNVTNYTVFDVTATTFKMNFNGGKIKLNSSFNYLSYGIFTINMDKTKDTKCYILNGNFDGSGNPADFSELNVHPKGGRGMFFINGARYVKADHLNFYYWFYSACIWTHYCKSADITNIEGTLVGGRSADNTEDARGDALYFGYVGVVEDEDNQPDVDNSYPVNINVENCHFSSWEAIPTLYPGANDGEGRNGSQSGRCGIVLGEYSRTNAKKVFNIKNCYFYNYQRSLHLENIYDVDVNVTDTTFENYGSVLLMSQYDRYGYINFNNCILKKDVNVIAIYDGYKYIMTGFTSNTCKGITYNGCEITDDYNSFYLYGKDVNLELTNCNITMERFEFSNNVYAKFNDCNIKYNMVNFYLSDYRFENCNIEGCYKHDASSKSIIYATAGTTSTVNNLVNNCTLKNVGFHQGGTRRLTITNNTFTIDTNYVNSDYSGTTRNYFLSVYGDKLEKYSGNILNNTNTTVTLLFDNANNGKYEIYDNVITNTKISIVNATGYKARVYNNKLINDSASYTTAEVDLYGSKCVFHDNQFIGFTNTMANYGSATQYNNYSTTDGTTNTLIS